ncbi:unnamed protein product [Clonostachys rhizophaga]|uniref:Uncharacterized protein n=1 Tax=Clonostachys rhizophaga TaxID=160324 RepID=A0A9N9VYJ5_9HYPO|nr:unnamed protein product [Clonostachys rhizophaga]
MTHSAAVDDVEGSKIYAITQPLRPYGIIEGLTALERAGKETAIERALSLFTSHGESIPDTGIDYPAHEVNFGQSIVAPVAIFLLELARYTGEDRWPEAAKEHFDLLLLFGGQQPDYHMHDVTIRHWDGYWFGKDRMWGEVFPYYWSTLTAIAMHHYAKLTEDRSYGRRAQEVLKSNLALFSSDGTASCVWLYPKTVNGRAGHYKEPYANDQDWALNQHLLLTDSL